MNYLTPGDDSQRPSALWLSWTPGTRVMIRRTLPQGSSHLFTDVLGTVVACTEDGIRLETRTGIVDVPGAEIATGKPIPPAPPRRRPRGPVVED